MTEIEKRRARERSRKSRAKARKRFTNNINTLYNLKSWIKKHSLLPFIDIEMFEFCQTQMLEFGVSIVNLETFEVTDTNHFIVEEHLNRRNKRYVCDNKDNFDHGDSIIMSAEQIYNHITTICSDHKLIGAFGTSGDCLFLRESGITVPTLRVDVPKLYCVAHKQLNPPSLIKMCQQYDIPLLHPHNAGNDAHATAHCAAKLLKMIVDNFDNLMEYNKNQLHSLYPLEWIGCDVNDFQSEEGTQNGQTI